MITLGIDPGTARLGYGVVDDTGEPRAVAFGVIETATGEAMPHRLNTLYERLVEIMQTHAPDALAVEQLFFARNVTNAMTVGQARGAMR